MLFTFKVDLELQEAMNVMREIDINSSRIHSQHCANMLVQIREQISGKIQRQIELHKKNKKRGNKWILMF